MRPSLDQFERVEAYVLNNLPVQERLAFEAELSENPELQSMVEFQQDVLKSVNRQAIRADIDVISRQFGQGGGGGHLPWKWIFSSLAVVVTGLATWFALSYNGESKQRDHKATPTTENVAPVSFTSNETATEELREPPLASVCPVFFDPVPVVMDLPKNESVPANKNKDEKYLGVVDFSHLDFLPPGFARAVDQGMPFNGHTRADQALTDSIYYCLKSFTRSADHTTDADNLGRRGPLLEKHKGFLNGDRVVRGRIVTKENTPVVWGVSATLVVDGKVSGKEIRINRRGYFRYTKAEAGNATLYFHSAVFKSDTLHFTIKKNSSKVTRLKPFQLEYQEEGNHHYRYNLNTGVQACFIDPLSIKVIRTATFAQTFLATPAFEQRLAKLHNQPNGQELLELYIGNLGKDLYQVDSMVATRMSTAQKADFVAFSREHLTNVRNRPNEKQLFASYEALLKAATDEARAAERAYCKKLSNQVEQLEKRIDALNAKTAKASAAAATGGREQIYSPKESTNKSDSGLEKLEAKLDKLVEEIDTEGAFLESLINFLDRCPGAVREKSSKVKVD